MPDVRRLERNPRRLREITLDGVRLAGRAAAVVSLQLLAYVVPPLAALRGSRTGLLGYLAAVTGRVITGRRTGSRVLPDALAHPASAAAFAWLTAHSFREHCRGELRWKGRPLP